MESEKELLQLERGSILELQEFLFNHIMKYKTKDLKAYLKEFAKDWGV